MGYKYTGDAILGVGLHVTSPKPIDDRLVVSNIEELYSIPAATAYEGMLVTNTDNGAAYILTNKNKINSPDGWAASYDAIQFVTCTLEEYEEWGRNTNDNNLPIDESKPYIHKDVYYYIYEESLSQELEDLEYVKASWAKQLETLVAKKADSDAVIQANNALNEFKEIAATIQYVADNYIPLSFIEGADEGGLSALFAGYYTKSDVDTLLDDYVTKESLQGDDAEGDFIFVKSSTYSADQQALSTTISQLQEELAKTIKVGEAGELESISVKLVQFPDATFKVEDGVAKVNDLLLAYTTDIPQHIVLTLDEYKALEESGELDEAAYYHILEDAEVHETYIVRSYLEDNYYTKTQAGATIAKAISDFVAGDLATMLAEYQKSDSFVLSSELENYYTKTHIDDTFETKSDLEDTLKNYVTLAMLGGESGDSEGPFIFVKKSEYQADKEALDATLANVLTKDDKNLEIESIISNDTTLTLDDGKVFVEKETKEELALKKDVPVVQLIPQDQYDELDDKDENTYYYVYNTDEEDAWVTAKELKNYDTTVQVDTKIKVLRDELNAAKEEINTLKEQLALALALIASYHPAEPEEEPEEPINPEP